MSKAWQDITPQEIEKILQEKREAQFIDVRNPDEFSAGHMEEAILIPLPVLPVRLPVLPVRLHELDPEKEVIFICRSGARSTQACEFAVSQGFTKVANMAGGMLNWKETK